MASNKPFEGVKVVNLGWVAVCPVTVKYLGDHGATVVKIESHARPDAVRFMGPFKDNIPSIDNSGMFANWNSSSLSLSLDLGKQRGRDIAWKMIEWADVLAESFVPGTMKKWGLDYESVSRVRPEIVYLSTCQQGQTGPRATYSGYGTLSASLAGFFDVNGWPDRGPMCVFGAYTDFIAPRFAAAAVLAALDYRRRTGKGQYLDQSQFESSVQFLAPPIMEYKANGSEMTRHGNRLDYAAPHGVYPCKGEERWCAIGVFSDAEWQAFCGAIGREVWLDDPRFDTLLARKQNEDLLDRLIGEWSSGQDAKQVEAILQSVGVAASVVETAKDLFEDPQMKHRGHFRQLQHSVMGCHSYDGPAFKLSRSADSQFASPALGEHNEYICREILGLSDNEIGDLIAGGVITTAADLPEVRVSF